MSKSIQELLKEYDRQMETNEGSANGKAHDCCGMTDGDGCNCCPMSGDDQFECCQLGGCLACVST